MQSEVSQHIGTNQQSVNWPIYKKAEVGGWGWALLLTSAVPNLGFSVTRPQRETVTRTVSHVWVCTVHVPVRVEVCVCVQHKMSPDHLDWGKGLAQTTYLPSCTSPMPQAKRMLSCITSWKSVRKTRDGNASLRLNSLIIVTEHHFNLNTS